VYEESLYPDKPLTQAERKIIERDLKITLENFITAVAENRKLDVEKVRALADGSSLLGEAALQNGLIDKIGGLFEAESYIKDKIQDEVNMCW
jgi:protease-4